MGNQFTIAGEGWAKEEIFGTEGALRDAVRRLAQKSPKQLIELTFISTQGRAKDLGYGTAQELKDSFDTPTITTVRRKK